MGLVRFQIILDNYQAVYYCGQQLTGHVVIAVDAPKKVRAIKLTIQGKSEVLWTETRQVSSTDSNGRTTHRTVTDTYSNEETYFRNESQVFGGGYDQTLEAGEHSYPFNFVLPYNIPSSFEGQYGHVRYSVKAKVDRPWKFDHETKTLFTVICGLDLNASPALMEPIQTSREKTFCCCCCASGPLCVILTQPTGGVVAGETLLPTVEVDNASRVHINSVSLQFVKTLTYKARQGRTKVEEKVICSKHLDQVFPHKTRTWPRQALTIPALPPSNLLHCSIIDLSYQVRVVCDPSGAHYKFYLNLPVTLGTIPFYRNFSEFSAPEPGAMPAPLGWNFAPSAPSANVGPSNPSANHVPSLPAANYVPSGPPANYDPSGPMANNGPSGPMANYGPSGPMANYGPSGPMANYGPSAPLAPQMDAPPAYSTLAPPAFEEAAHGGWSVVEKDEGEHMHGDKNFTPRYPVFRQQSKEEL